MQRLTLHFDGLLGIYLVAYVAVPVLFFLKAGVNTGRDTFSITRGCASRLKGLFLVVVILHHISTALGANDLTALKYMGNNAVGVFFALSGFGLMKSLRHDGNYLQHFLRNKVVRLYVPLILVNALTVLALLMSGRTVAVSEVVRYVLGITLIDTTLWFVVTILLFYFFFWLCFRRKNGAAQLACLTILVLAYAAGCRLVGVGSYFYTSSFCFLMGAVYGFFEHEVNSFLYDRYLPLTGSLICLFALTFTLYRMEALPGMSYVSCLFFTASVITVFLRIAPRSALFDAIGNLSLEMYLLHMKVLAVFALFTGIDSGLWMALFMGVLFVCARLLNGLNRFLSAWLSAPRGGKFSPQAVRG